MTHIQQRIRQRVIDEALAKRIEARCHLAAERMDRRRSFAVRVAKLNEVQGVLTYEEDGSGISNGDCGVAIIRNGALHTFMWRRIEQPHTKQALRVDVATCFKDVCTHGQEHH